MEELLKSLGLDENALTSILEKHTELTAAAVEAAENVLKGEISGLNTKISEFEEQISQKDGEISELTDKYNDTENQLKKSGYRELLFGEGIENGFVRGALARELEEKGFDLKDDTGLNSAKDYIAKFKQDNQSLFADNTKPKISIPAAGGNQKKENGVEAHFKAINPGINI